MDAPVAKLHDALAIQLPSNSLFNIDNLPFFEDVCFPIKMKVYLQVYIVMKYIYITNKEVRRNYI